MTSCTQVAHSEPWDSFPHMANCEPCFQVDHMALPSVTLLGCHVASPNLAMCHSTPHASKNVKSRRPRNPTKFDVVAKFRETISTEKWFCHPRSRKIPDFYRNYDFALFEKLKFSRVLHSPLLKKNFVPKFHAHTHPTMCICNLT